MSKISNKFFVSIIEDGTTLHGQLLSTKSLTQAYKDGVCVPDWKNDAASQPVIYLSLLDGATAVAVDAGYKWYYNGTEIAFGDDGKSTDGLFEKVLYTTNGVQMPALKIIGNLASSSNVDIDVIRFSGTKTMASSPVDFSASVNVSITEWSTTGYFGTLSFPQGMAITSDQKQVSAEALLYDETGATPAGAGYRWYLNETEVTSKSTSSDAYVSGTNGDKLIIKEAAVTDNAMIRCDFLVDGEVVYTRYESVDDQTDDEYLWVMRSDGSGSEASLRKDESVTFVIFVGTVADPTPNADWKTFAVKLLNADGNVIKDNISGIPDADDNGYRDISKSIEGGKARITITYELGKTLGKKGLTGIILASD